MVKQCFSSTLVLAISPEGQKYAMESMLYVSPCLRKLEI
jgi:hypothetical protein